jgi:protoporphyrinogen/coproporphyrinogen III oxidase
MSRRVVIVGGGVAGLAAAQALSAADDTPQVILLEASERVGGRIRTVPFGGVQLDVGPDALLSRAPGGVELCRSLGLGDELLPCSDGGAFVWSRGKLRRLPAGLLAGLPAGPGELLRSRILSPAGLGRAGLDLVLPGNAPAGDEAIGALVRRRLGGQVLDRLIDPLLGGINAGHCDDLSVAAGAPYLATAARANRSLVRGLRATMPSAPSGAPRPPAFLTLRGGLERLVGALAEQIDGVDVRVNTAVHHIERAEGGLVLVLESGERLSADGVVLATPAGPAADVVRAAAPVAADELAGIRTASVALVALAYPHEAVPPLDGTGFLVARDEDLDITACTWATAKWPHLAEGATHTILKCSLGRAGEDAVVGESDDALIARARRALERTMKISQAPADAIVVRHLDAFPQYAVGHLDRVTRIEEDLQAALPGLALAGNAYRGVGVPACITSGRAAAERLLQAAPAPASHPQELNSR